MERKIDFSSAKSNAFHLQQQPLFRGSFKTNFDFATGAYHPLPRQPVWRFRSEQPRHRAMIQRISRRCGNLPVRRDLAFWNGKNHSTEGRIAQLVRPRTGSQDSIYDRPVISP